jgi:ABC-type multidrug transport system fused ATPase/permease subunit
MTTFFIPKATTSPKDYDLVIFAFMLCAPNIILYFCSVTEPNLRVGGMARASLWISVMRRYYHLESRDDVPKGDMMTMLQKDVMMVVENGFMMYFKLLEILLQTFFNFLFQLAILGPMWFALLGPFVLMNILVFHLRKRETIKKSASALRGFKNLMIYFEEVLQSARLVLDYSIVDQILEDCTTLSKVCNKAIMEDDVYTNVNKFSPFALTDLLQGLWIIVGGLMLIESTQVNALESISVATYLSIMLAIRQLGGYLTEMTNILYTVRSSFPAFHRVASILNGEEIFEVCLSEQRLAEKDGWDAAPGVDEPIRLVNVSFRDKLKGVNLNLRQGSLVCLEGPANQGKRLLLRIIGKKLHPEKGYVIIPGSVRYLSVVPEALFIGDSIQGNLLLSIAHEERSKMLPFAIQMCKSLRCPQALLKKIMKDDSVGKLSRTDKALLNLVRAFMSRAHMLILDQPSMYGEHDQEFAIGGLMRAYVDRRGAVCGMTTDGRPRTIVFTSRDSNGMKMADITYVVANGKVQTENKTVVKAAQLFQDHIYKHDENVSNWATKDMDNTSSASGRGQHEDAASMISDIFPPSPEKAKSPEKQGSKLGLKGSPGDAIGDIFFDSEKATSGDVAWPAGP